MHTNARLLNCRSHSFGRFVFKTVGSTVLGGLWADFYSSMKTLGATGLGGLWAFVGVALC